MEKIKFTRLLPKFDQAGDMSNASSQIKDASNAGSTAINSYDPQASSLGAINQGTNLAQTAFGQNTKATDPLSAAIKANPTVTSLYQQGNNLYNVEPLARLAANLSDRVTNATPDSYAASRGYDISETDRANGEASKLAYLTPQMNAAQNNYNTAAGLSSNFVNAGIQQNQQNLIPAQTNASLVGNEIAQEQTGWNADLAKQLDGLLAKMQSGEKLSEAELSAATSLAQTEANYNSAVTTANLKNQFIPVTKGDNLVNTFAQTIMNPSTLTAPRGGVASYG